MVTATSNDRSDLSLRLVRLFSQAGLLDETEVNKYGKSHDKSIVDILNQDVSVDAFRELLFAEIRLPFKRKSETPRLTEQLGASADLRSEELLQMLTKHRPKLDVMVRQLLESGVVSRDVLVAALQKAEQLEEDPYQWLVRNDVISPATIGSFLRSASNPLTKPCALALALWILQHNRIITPERESELLAKLSEGGDGVAGEVRRELHISSADLLAKIDAGLYLPDAQGEIAADPALVDFFPESVIRRHIFLPISQKDSELSVAIADPLNLNLAVLIRWLTGLWMEPVFAPSGRIIDHLNDAFGVAREPEEHRHPVIQAPAASGSSPAEPPPAEPAAAKAPAKGKAKAPAAKAPAKASSPSLMMLRPGEAPDDSVSAVQLVSSIIESAIDLRATDIHLESTRTNMIARFRIDGVLTKILTIPANLTGPVTSRIKVLANMNVTERRRPQDGHIMLDMNDRHFDFRIATMPTVFGEKVAIRILDSARVMTGLADLGLNKKQIEIANRMIHRPHGIILVTGPTGSGKTSSLYSALRELNSEQRHLVTIEDPVEYQLDGVNQIQVNPDIGLTFSEGLRAILRQDPNIIMVGEIRDADTAKVAIRAALTGHLVFSTLHTNTAIAAIQALSTLGASPYMLGSALTGVIAQRLVRKLCEKCKKERPVTKALATEMGLTWTKSMKLFKAVGCDECLGTGYSGRIGIFEILEMTEPLRMAILADESPTKLIEIANAEGRISIQEAGMEKVREGVTSAEELVQKVILDA